MENERRILWLVWAAMLACLGLYLAIPLLVPPRPEPWYDAQTSVAQFVAALLSMAAAVGSFSLRESLVLRELRRGTLDPTSPIGFVIVRRALVVLWALCEVIALLGLGVALGSGRPPLAWLYTALAAVLLVIHAPRAWYFARPVQGASGSAA
jgi:hypothetical protein